VVTRFVGFVLTGLIAASAIADSTVDSVANASILAGEKLFRVHCARCHGMQGEGGEGANLARPKLKYAKNDQQLYDILDDGIAGTGMPSVWVLDDEQLWHVTAYVRSLGQMMEAEMPGDPRAGKAIYEGKGGCPACHIVSGRGKGIGPELTEIGDQRGIDYLRRSLQEPAGNQPKTAGYSDYLTVRATTAYATVEGMRINEDAFSIQVRDLSGQVHSFRKSELTDFEKVFAHSLMPEYGAVMADNDLDDVVSYLMSLRSAP
jgi:putative heme-binding domain-containing protein